MRFSAEVEDSQGLFVLVLFWVHSWGTQHKRLMATPVAEQPRRGQSRDWEMGGRMPLFVPEPVDQEGKPRLAYFTTRIRNGCQLMCT